MENKRIIKFAAIILVTGALASAPVLLNAYEPETTHKALTQEMVLFFNHYYPDLALNNEAKELLMQGSFDEDFGIRAMHHFYDPINNKGISLGKEWIHAKQWAEDTLAQATTMLRAENIYGNIVSYFSSDSDFSWDRAIYEYAWQDKNRGLITLGHILHLIEDMAVPDHTRNDRHPPYANSVFHQASPYEHWADKWNLQTVSIASDLSKFNKVPVNCVSLGSCFDAIARYSNNNFFSKDTILKYYSSPIISFERGELLSDNRFYVFGYFQNKYNENYRLVHIEKKIDGSEPLFSIKDKDNLILTDYWNHLSKQAVLHGAGVIKLFFDEIAKEKQTKLLYEKNRSWVMRRVDDVVYAYNIAEAKTISAYESASSWLAQRADNIKQDFSAITDYAGNIWNKNNQALLSAAFEPKPENKTVLNSEPIAPSINTGITKITDENQTKFISPETTVSGTSTGEAIQPSVVSATTSEILIYSSASSTAVTSEAQSTGTTSIEIQPSDDNNVQLLNSPPLAIWGQGSSGSNNNALTETGPVILPDTIAPVITLEIPACAYSFSDVGCVLATSTVTIQWSSADSDVAVYQISCMVDGVSCAEFPQATSTSGSRIINVNSNNIYRISLTAQDTAGNTASAITKEAEINFAPVVINEIGWGGTTASFQDEYIELFNTASFPISLEKFTLYSQTDMKPYLSLNGIIPAQGYYLIERTNDTTISDISADLIASFGAGEGGGLVNSGEVLVLSHGSTTVDITPSCFRWCYGINTGYSMERIQPSAAGDDTNNWSANNGFITRGKDANGGMVLGTPKSRNSQNYMVSSFSHISGDRILKASESPFIIPFDLAVPAGSSLIVSAGTVIKIIGSRSISVDGTMQLKGSALEPVVITSFYDDEFGGDLNNDGTSTVPHKGDWNSIIFNRGSTNSFIQNSIIRYGGKAWSGVIMPKSLIYIDSTNIPVKDSILENADVYGIRLADSSSGITGNIIRNMSGSSVFGSTGILAEGGNPKIKNNTFDSNIIGLSLSGGRGNIDGNIFKNSAQASAFITSSCPALGMNMATGSPVNGFIWQGIIADDCALGGNTPLIIRDGGLTATASATISVLPGTIIKFNGMNASMNIGGRLLAEGTEADKIYFTSFYDDEFGGDTNGDGLSQGRAGDWNGIFITGNGTSSITNAVFKYGGKFSFLAPKVMLYLQNGTADISDTIFEAGDVHSLAAVNSPYLKISNTNFSKNNARPNSSALYLENSSAALANLIFRENNIAIESYGSTIISAAGIDIDTTNAVSTIPVNLLP